MQIFVAFINASNVAQWYEVFNLPLFVVNQLRDLLMMGVAIVTDDELEHRKPLICSTTTTNHS